MVPQLLGAAAEFLEVNGHWQDFKNWLFGNESGRMYSGFENGALAQLYIDFNSHQSQPAISSSPPWAPAHYEDLSATPAPLHMHDGPILPHVPTRLDNSGQRLIDAATEEERRAVQFGHPACLNTNEPFHGLDPHPPYEIEIIRQRKGKHIYDRVHATRAARDVPALLLHFGLGVSPLFYVPRVRINDVGEREVEDDGKTYASDEVMNLEKHKRMEAEYRARLNLSQKKLGIQTLEDEMLALAAMKGFKGIRDGTLMGGDEWVEFLLAVTFLPHFDKQVAECIHRYEPQQIEGVGLTIRLFDQKKRYYWHALDQYLAHCWVVKRTTLQNDWDALHLESSSSPYGWLAGTARITPEQQASCMERLRASLPSYHPMALHPGRSLVSKPASSSVF